MKEENKKKSSTGNGRHSTTRPPTMKVLWISVLTSTICNLVLGSDNYPLTESAEFFTQYAKALQNGELYPLKMETSGLIPRNETVTESSKANDFIAKAMKSSLDESNKTTRSKNSFEKEKQFRTATDDSNERERKYRNTKTAAEAESRMGFPPGFISMSSNPIPNFSPVRMVPFQEGGQFPLTPRIPDTFKKFVDVQHHTSRRPDFEELRVVGFLPKDKRPKPLQGPEIQQPSGDSIVMIKEHRNPFEQQPNALPMPIEHVPVLAQPPIGAVPRPIGLAAGHLISPPPLLLVGGIAHPEHSAILIPHMKEAPEMPVSGTIEITQAEPSSPNLSKDEVPQSPKKTKSKKSKKGKGSKKSNVQIKHSGEPQEVHLKESKGPVTPYERPDYMNERPDYVNIRPDYINERPEYVNIRPDPMKEPNQPSMYKERPEYTKELRNPNHFQERPDYREQKHPESLLQRPDFREQKYPQNRPERPDVREQKNLESLSERPDYREQKHSENFPERPDFREQKQPESSLERPDRFWNSKPSSDMKHIPDSVRESNQPIHVMEKPDHERELTPYSRDPSSIFREKPEQLRDYSPKDFNAKEERELTPYSREPSGTFRERPEQLRDYGPKEFNAKEERELTPYSRDPSSIFRERPEQLRDYGSKDFNAKEERELIPYTRDQSNNLRERPEQLRDYGPKDFNAKEESRQIPHHLQEPHNSDRPRIPSFGEKLKQNSRQEHMVASEGEFVPEYKAEFKTYSTSDHESKFELSKPALQIGYQVTYGAGFKPHNPFEASYQSSYEVDDKSAYNHDTPYKSESKDKYKNSYESENTPHYEPHPMYKSQKTPYEGSEHKPSYESEYKPTKNQDYRSSYEEEYKPTYDSESNKLMRKPDYKPFEQEYRPEKKPEFKPYSESSYKPSYEPGYKQSYEPNYKTEKKLEYMEYKPDYQSSNEPSYGYKKKPSFGEEKEYERNSETENKPSFEPNYKPERKPDFRPSFEPEYKPSFESDFKAERKPDHNPPFEPERKPENKPSFEPEYRPSFESEFRAERKPDFKQPTFDSEYKPERRPDFNPSFEPEKKPDYQSEENEYKPNYQPEPESYKGEYRPELNKPEYKPEPYKLEHMPESNKLEYKPVYRLPKHPPGYNYMFMYIKHEPVFALVQTKGKHPMGMPPYERQNGNEGYATDEHESRLPYMPEDRERYPANDRFRMMEREDHPRNQNTPQYVMEKIPTYRIYRSENPSTFDRSNSSEGKRGSDMILSESKNANDRKMDLPGIKTVHYMEPSYVIPPAEDRTDTSKSNQWFMSTTPLITREPLQLSSEESSESSSEMISTSEGQTENPQVTTIHTETTVNREPVRDNIGSENVMHSTEQDVPMTTTPTGRSENLPSGGRNTLRRPERMPTSSEEWSQESRSKITNGGNIVQHFHGDDVSEEDFIPFKRTNYGTKIKKEEAMKMEDIPEKLPKTMKPMKKLPFPTLKKPSFSEKFRSRFNTTHRSI